MATDLQWTVTHYDNGAVYEGYIDAQHRRQLVGRFSKGGATYEGEFVDGQMHGHGRYTYDEAATRTYTGNFANGEIHGDGVSEGPTFSFVGSHSAGRKHGKGVIIPSTTGTTQRHIWAKGHPTETTSPTLPEILKEYTVRRRRILSAVAASIPPLGTPCEEGWHDARETRSQTLPSGCTYSGSFFGAKRSGHGVWEHPEGDRYEGQWMDNKKSGWGVYTSDARRYEGEWCGDKMNGWGVQTAAGGVFVGKHHEDAKCGIAVVFSTEGDEKAAPMLQDWRDGTLHSEKPASEETAAEYSMVRKILEATVRGACKAGQADV